MKEEVEVTVFGDARRQYLVYDNETDLKQGAIYHDRDFHGGCHRFIKISDELFMRFRDYDGHQWTVVSVGRDVHPEQECPTPHVVWQ